MRPLSWQISSHKGREQRIAWWIRAKASQEAGRTAKGVCSRGIKRTKIGWFKNLLERIANKERGDAAPRWETGENATARAHVDEEVIEF